MSWTIRISKRAKRSLSKLTKDEQQMMAKAIDEMHEEPFGPNVIRLKGQHWKGHFRRRVGRYRIIFLPQYASRIIDVQVIRLRNKRTYE